jgi:hypothetical protein
MHLLLLCVVSYCYYKLDALKDYSTDHATDSSTRNRTLSANLHRTLPCILAIRNMQRATSNATVLHSVHNES